MRTVGFLDYNLVDFFFCNYGFWFALKTYRGTWINVYYIMEFNILFGDNILQFFDEITSKLV